MKTAVMILLVTVSVSACQTYRSKDATNSTWFRIPVDSQVLLQRELIIEPYEDRLYFQNGIDMTYRDVNRYLPYCAIRLNARKSVETKIAPDVLRIKKVYHQLIFDLALLQQPLAGFGGGNGEPYQVMATFMEIHSANQPDVTGLICSHWSLPQGDFNQTLNDIQQSAGDVFTIKFIDN